MMVSFVLSFFPRDVLDEILNLIESVSEDFPSYSLYQETQPQINLLSSTTLSVRHLILVKRSGLSSVTSAKLLTVSGTLAFYINFMQLV